MMVKELNWEVLDTLTPQILNFKYSEMVLDVSKMISFYFARARTIRPNLHMCSAFDIN